MLKRNRFLAMGLAMLSAVMVLFTVATVSAAEPLVGVDWVKANSAKAGVVFIDVRAKSDFLRGHIPGAVNTSYGKSGWRVTLGGVPGMLPENTANLATLIGDLGIDNNTHVVLVAPGNNSTDMGVATRMYWTFKVLGHENVSILNGGMKAYLAAQDKAGKPTNPLQKGQVKIDKKTFNVNLRKDMLPSTKDVQAAMKNGMVLVDNRPDSQYRGVNRHPKAKANGTIPGALSMPQSWLTENGGGTFRSKSVIAQLYKAAGVPTDGEQINFCNTGHWASVGWFASSEILGNKNVKMYDGSMLAWTMAKLPTEIKIRVQ